MKKSAVIWLVVIIIIVVLGIWYWSAEQSNYSSATIMASSTASSPVAAGGAPANIIVLNTTSTASLGTFLVAMNGMTLYQYTKDMPNVSTCAGQCATIWPPYTVPANQASSSFVGTAGANGQVGVIMRADGTDQYTYNGIPLYFYSKDTQVGDTNGQNVGGTWFVVSP